MNSPSFEQLMQQARMGCFEEDLRNHPRNEIRGFITPTQLVGCSYLAGPIHKAIIMACLARLALVAEITTNRFLNDPKTAPLALGLVSAGPSLRPRGFPADFTVLDLVEVRMPYEVTQEGESIQLRIWHDIRTQLKHNVDGPYMAWPSKTDVKNTHWPIRMFAEALAVGAVVGAGRRLKNARSCSNQGGVQ